MYLPGDLTALAARQWGVVSRAQALEALTPSQIRSRCQAGILLPAGRGVYLLAGGRRSWRQRAMASCLAYGAPVALSHRAAARLWGLEGVLAIDPEVTVPPGRSGRRPGIQTYRARLDGAEVTTHDDIPVTTPARTLRDLVGVVPPGVLERAVDQARRMHLVTAGDLAWLSSDGSGTGHRGSRALRRLLPYRLEERGVGDSAWDDRVWRWIVDAGLEPPERQVQVALAGTLRVLDMAYVALKIAIELAGFEWHGQHHRFDSDAARSTELQLEGWLVLTVTSRQSRHEVVDRVRRSLAARAPDPPAVGQRRS